MRKSRSRIGAAVILSLACGGRVLRLGLISIQGFTGPTHLATCTFVSVAGAPDPDQFVVQVEEAATPVGRTVDAAAGVVVEPRQGGFLAEPQP